MLGRRRESFSHFTAQVFCSEILEVDARRVRWVGQAEEQSQAGCREPRGGVEFDNLQNAAQTLETAQYLHELGIFDAGEAFAQYFLYDYRLVTGKTRKLQNQPSRAAILANPSVSMRW